VKGGSTVFGHSYAGIALSDKLRTPGGDMSDPSHDEHQSLRAAAQVQSELRGQRAARRSEGNGPLSEYFDLGRGAYIVIFGVLSIVAAGLIALLILTF
jgi:hypothetical protein